MTITVIAPRPAAWDVLARALAERRPVRASYRGIERILCPHALGWKNQRPKLLAYQSDGTTSHGPLPADPRQRWRSIYIDEIETVDFTDGPWQSAPNYSLDTNAIDHIELALNP